MVVGKINKIFGNCQLGNIIGKIACVDFEKSELELFKDGTLIIFRITDDLKPEFRILRRKYKSKSEKPIKSAKIARTPKAKRLS